MSATNFITISPVTGSGDQNLTITATAHTGRESRALRFTLAGTGSYLSVSGDNDLVVTQAGHAAFINMGSGNEMDYNEQSSTFGTSQDRQTNLQKLKITAAQSNDLSQYLTAAAIDGVALDASGLSALKSANGYEPDGDPGAVSSYPVILTFSGIPVNSGSSAIVYTCTIGYGTSSATITLTHNAQSVTPPAPSILFKSTVSGDYESSSDSTSDITVTLNSDGTGWSDGVTRTISVDASDAQLTWAIVPDDGSDSGSGSE